MFTFLAATQDIVIDGWALTMLSKYAIIYFSVVGKTDYFKIKLLMERENVAWSSTCNSVGQTIGWFLGNVIFLVLESDEFCNKYIRSVFGLESQNYGLVTFKCRWCRHSMVINWTTFGNSRFLPFFTSVYGLFWLCFHHFDDLGDVIQKRKTL
jgi:hypothetical protein